MPTTSPEAEASIRGLAVWFQLGMLRDANKIGDSGKIPKPRLYSEREVIQALLLVGTGMLICSFLFFFFIGS